MDRLINADVAIKELIGKPPYKTLEWEKKAAEFLNRLETIDAVSNEVFEQVKWERDIATEQLNSIGKSLGEKMDDVETVHHGHWVKKMYTYHCSECQTIGSPQWKRCPVCEAKMDREDKK